MRGLSKWPLWTSLLRLPLSLVICLEPPHRGRLSTTAPRSNANRRRLKTSYGLPYHRPPLTSRCFFPPRFRSQRSQDVTFDNFSSFLDEKVIWVESLDIFAALSCCRRGTSCNKLSGVQVHHIATLTAPQFFLNLFSTEQYSVTISTSSHSFHSSRQRRTGMLHTSLTLASCKNAAKNPASEPRRPRLADSFNSTSTLYLELRVENEQAVVAVPGRVRSL